MEELGGRVIDAAVIFCVGKDECDADVLQCCSSVEYKQFIPSDYPVLGKLRDELLGYMIRDLRKGR